MEAKHIRLNSDVIHEIKLPCDIGVKDTPMTTIGMAVVSGTGTETDRRETTGHLQEATRSGRLRNFSGKTAV